MHTTYIKILGTQKAFRLCGLYILIVLVFGVLLPNVSDAQSTAKNEGIFYAITGNGLKETSYLFGTYHLVKSSYLDNATGVKSALDKASGIVVELVIDSTKLTGAMEMGYLKGKTLSGMLDPAIKDSLELECMGTLGVGVQQLNNLKPVNVILALSMVHLMKNNALLLEKYTGQPLDAYFATTASQKNKPITQLETLEEQMDLLFNRTTDKEQAKQLSRFLQNKKTMISMGDDLLSAWINNDLQKMESIYKQTTALSGEMDYLLKDRNEKWIKLLPGLLQKSSQFIGVGALHLAGPDGLVAQLRKKGYSVTALKL